MNGVVFRRLALSGRVRCLVLAVAGVAASTGLSAQTNLVTNGEFVTNLNNWKVAGPVTGGGGKATLSEGETAATLYQAVDVSSLNSYAYELRFDVYLGGMSSSAGVGEVDRGRLSILGGTNAATLTPDSAVEERVLLEASAAGPIPVAANVSGVPNAALGPNWYSVVVEFVSDFEAIAPHATILNNNGGTDSSLSVSNVRLYALNRGRLANISNRGPVGTGNSIMIPGFAIAGITPKDLLIRGVGPTLGGFGVQGTITDPTIRLFASGVAQPLVTNDNWEDSGNATELKAAFGQVGAFDLGDGAKDAALLIRDLAPGVYTVQLSGVGGVTGVGLAEVYDLGAGLDGPTELTNISNRGFIGSGSSVQIPGFVIGGTRGKKVLIRAVGPTLGGFGVQGALEDPILQLIKQGIPGPLFANDNWEDNENAAQIAATATLVGAFDLAPGSADAALLIALEPGNYTAVARGKGDLTGVALVEVYMVTSNQRPVAVNNSLYVNSAQANSLNMEEILGNDLDPDGDVLFVKDYTQPPSGTVALNDSGVLVYTSPIGYFGESVFSYTVTDGEYESVPAVVALQVVPANAKIWQGGTSGNFSNPDNWAGGVVPGPTDPVWIAEQGEYTITIDQDATVASLRAGATGAKVTVAMTNGRSLTAAGGVEIARGSTLQLTNGTLTTSQNARIFGTLNWGGGTMNGAGTTVIEQGGMANLTGSPLLTGNRNLLNRGTVNQTGGSYLRTNGGSNSTVTNAAGAAWNANIANGTYIAYSEDGSSTLNFVNAGRLTKSGTGTSYLGYSGGSTLVNNVGTIEVLAGVLQYEGNGASTHGGTLEIADGASTFFNRGTHSFPTGAKVNGDGEFYVGSGAVTLTDSYTLPKLRVTAGSLTYSGSLNIGVLAHSGGTIAGNGSMTITESAAWTSSTVQAGTGTTIIASGATATMDGGHYLDGNRNLTNNGTMTQTGGTYFRSRSGGSSTVTNADGANWIANLANGTYIAYAEDGSSTLDFVNAGTLTKTGTGTNYLGYSQGTTRVTNSGSIVIEGGVLQYEGIGASTHGGSVSIADGTSYVFNRGTHTFPAEGEITGDGAFYVASATVVLTDNYTLPKLTVTAGSLTYNGTLTVGTLAHSGGTITGAGNLTITGSADWTGNTAQAGAGTTVIASGATATMTGSHALDSNRKFTNNGTFTQTGGTYFRTRGGSTSTMTNGTGANWNVNIAANYNFAYSEDGSSILNFVNAGTLTKQGSGLAYLGSSSGETRVTNSGSIVIEGGVLQYEGLGASTHSGSVAIADGASYLFNRGTHTFPTGGDISGAGTFYVASATVVLTDSYTLPKLTVAAGSLTYNGTLTVGTLAHSAGTITGAGNLTITGSAAWTSNTTQAGAGTTIIASGASATMEGSHLMQSNRKLTNNGTFTQTGGTWFRTNGGSTSTVTNAVGANWNVNVASNYTFAYSEDGSSILNFVNAGTLTKQGSGLTYWGTAGGETRITNSGSVVVAGGTLQFEGLGPSTHGGTLSIADGATALFNRGTHAFPSGAAISGDGVYAVGGVGVVTLTNNLTLPKLTVFGGSLTYNGTLSVGALNHSAGTIAGAGNLTLTGTATWTNNSVQSGNGTTIIANGAVATMTGSHLLTGNRDFTNNGSLTQSGAVYFRTNGNSNTTVTNGNGATWVMNIAANYRNLYCEGGADTLVFVNNGTVSRTSAGLLYFGYSTGTNTLTNNGTMDLSGGTVQFDFTAVTLAGAGTLKLTTDGTTKPMTRSGALAIGGTLQVDLAAGYSPANGTTVRLIDYGSKTGTFSTVTPPQGRSVSVAYAGNGLDVTIN